MYWKKKSASVNHLIRAPSTTKPKCVPCLKKIMVSFSDRSIFRALVFKGELDRHWKGASFLGSHMDYGKKKQSIFNEYPPDLAAGTSMFFANMIIIEQQHFAGFKSLFLRIIDSQRRVSNGCLDIDSTALHQTISDFQCKKLITSTIEELQIELVTSEKVPFLGTGRIELTLNFNKFWKWSLFTSVHWSRESEVVLLTSSKCWSDGDEVCL